MNINLIKTVSEINFNYYTSSRAEKNMPYNEMEEKNKSENAFVVFCFILFCFYCIRFFPPVFLYCYKQQLNSHSQELVVLVVELGCKNHRQSVLQLEQKGPMEI